MRFSGISLALLAMLSLSACGSIYDDPSQHSDVSNWWSSRDSKMEEKYGRIPHGYAGHHPQAAKPRVLRPGDIVDDGSVTVYGLDDANAPAPVYDTVEELPAPVSAEQVDADYGYGELKGQIYFLHGSSHLTGGEKRMISGLAGELKQSSSPVAVTVVGHASQRVDGVTDPMRKKIINFEMAQRRAEAVTRELNRAGLDPAWVQAVSKGDEEPNPSPAGRTQEAADRRADIFVK